MSVPSCLCGDFEFYVTYNSVTTEVYPINFLETSLIDELERDQIFYRRKFSGSLIFGGKSLKTDFDYFRSIEQSAPCARLDFTIYKDSVIYWSGYFSTSNGSWDLDNCTFTITPLLQDDYTDILDGADLEYNILSSGALSEVTTTYDDGDTTIVYTHNRLFYDVIEYLADKIIPGITISSTFFEEATNPVTLTTNHYDYLTIAQKSDIKNPTASNPARTGMMSFNQIMQICRAMNLYWDYDGTTLRVEHISFWPSVEGISIRDQKLAQGTNKYKYINEQIPKYEKFSWMEADTLAFIGYPIWYNSDCVNQDPESNVSDIAISTVTTDIEYIIRCMDDPDDAGSSISNNGWVLLANELRGSDLYIRLTYVDSGYVHFNADLSWELLHKSFFKHGRQLISGYMNNSLTTFITAKKIKQQECNIIYCDEWDSSEHITTELGDDYFSGEKGKVSKAVIKPYGEINLTLMYGPVDGVNTGITYSKFVKIKQINAGLFAVLTEVSGSDVDIVVENTDCYSNPNADLLWTINAGNYTETLPVVHRIVTSIYTTTPGWDIYFEPDYDYVCV